MKLFGLAIMAAMLAASFVSFAYADEGNLLEATVSATGILGTSDAASDTGTPETWETVSSKCIVSANGIRRVNADCAVKYCSRPVASAADFERCAKPRIRASNIKPVPSSVKPTAFDESKCAKPVADARTAAMCAKRKCAVPVAATDRDSYYNCLEKSCIELTADAASAKVCLTAMSSGAGPRPMPVGINCNAPLTSAAMAIKCARITDDSTPPAVPDVAVSIEAAARAHKLCITPSSLKVRADCLMKVKAQLEDARTDADDAASAKAGMRYAFIAKAIGVKLTDANAADRIEVEVKARDDAYTEADDDYKASSESLKELRLKKVSKEHRDYKEAVNKLVRGHVQRLKAALSKLEASGIDTTDAQAKLDAWIAAWQAADTKAEKLEVIRAINAEWPGIRQSLQEQFRLAGADELSARVLRIAATARVTAAGVDARGGDSTAIIEVAARLEGISAKLSAATTVDEVRAANAELEPAFRDLRAAIKTAIASVTGAVVTPEVGAAVEATVESTVEAESPTVEATVESTVEAESPTVEATGEPTVEAGAN